MGNRGRAHTPSSTSTGAGGGASRHRQRRGRRTGRRWDQGAQRTARNDARTAEIDSSARWVHGHHIESDGGDARNACGPRGTVSRGWSDTEYACRRRNDAKRRRDGQDSGERAGQTASKGLCTASTRAGTIAPVRQARADSTPAAGVDIDGGYVSQQARLTLALVLAHPDRLFTTSLLGYLKILYKDHRTYGA